MWPNLACAKSASADVQVCGYYIRVRAKVDITDKESIGLEWGTRLRDGYTKKYSINYTVTSTIRFLPVADIVMYISNNYKTMSKVHKAVCQSFVFEIKN